MTSAARLFLIFVLLPASAPLLAQERKPDAPWSGEGEFGYVRTTGNTDTASLNAKFGLKHQRERWSHTLRFEATQKKERDVTTAERYYAAAKSDYSLTARDYAFGTLDYEDDRFDGYEYRANAGLGYGRRLIDRNTLKLNAEVGPGYRWNRLPSGESESETTLRLAGNLEWKISPTAKLTEEASVVSGGNDTVSRSLTALTTKINSQLSLRLSYLWKRRSDPPPGTVDTDTETAATLVYSF